MNRSGQRPQRPAWRRRMYEVIFEADTRAGRAFDVALLVAILASIVAVSLETVQEARREYGAELTVAEWCFTVLFTLEYALRLMCVRRPMRYAWSFWGLVDLLAFLPTYLIFFGAPFQSFFMLRTIRLLRVFRVLKLMRLSSEAEVLRRAVWRSREKVVVFLAFVLVAVTVTSTLMYHVERYGEVPGRPSQFTSIPQAMYWAIVTMTTVGYGDVVPMTTTGKLISAALILLGYSLIIVPTGFVTAEITKVGGPANGPETAAAASDAPREAVCAGCGRVEHPAGASYCNRCGQRL